MTKHALCGWEQNGPSDSDWLVAYYDDDLDKIDYELVGTTRAAAPVGYVAMSKHGLIPISSPEVLEKARKHLAAHIHQKLVLAEANDVMEPTSLERGAKVRLKFDIRNQVKDSDPAKCPKCAGSGKWTNPRREDDERDCYECHGSGEIRINYRKRLDEKGKPVWEKFDAGTVGEVLGSRPPFAFGGKRTYVVKLVDGRIARTTIDKLRLDKDLATEEVLLARAEELSHQHQYKPMVSRHGGWLCHDWASALAMRAKEASDGGQDVAA